MRRCWSPSGRMRRAMVPNSPSPRSGSGRRVIGTRRATRVSTSSSRGSSGSDCLRGRRLSWAETGGNERRVAVTAVWGDGRSKALGGTCCGTVRDDERSSGAFNRRRFTRCFLRRRRLSGFFADVRLRDLVDRDERAPRLSHTIARLIAYVSCAVVLWAGGGTSTASASNPDVIRACSGVCQIEIRYADPNGRPRLRVPDRSWGRAVVTNWHVVAGGVRGQLSFGGNDDTVSFGVAGYSIENGLAILVVDAEREEVLAKAWEFTLAQADPPPAAAFAIRYPRVSASR